MQKTPQKLIDLFEATKDDAGRIAFSLTEFEAIVFKYGPAMLNQSSKDDRVRAWGFWILFGTIFFVGTLVGWYMH